MSLRNSSLCETFSAKNLARTLTWSEQQGFLTFQLHLQSRRLQLMPSGATSTNICKIITVSLGLVVCTMFHDLDSQTCAGRLWKSGRGFWKLTRCESGCNYANHYLLWSIGSHGSYNAFWYFKLALTPYPYSCQLHVNDNEPEKMLFIADFTTSSDNGSIQL